MILIGKGRRITIEELVELCWSEDGIEVEIEDYKSSEGLCASKEKVDWEGKEDLVSVEVQRGLVLLLANNICQCRLVKKQEEAYELALKVLGCMKERWSSKVGEWPLWIKDAIPEYALERCLAVSGSAVYVGWANALMRPSYAIAALSCERAGVKVGDLGDYEAVRPHREMIVCCQVLKAMLEQSRAPGTQDSEKSALCDLPDCLGAGRAVLLSVYKAVELECNCFEVNKALDMSVLYLNLHHLTDAIDLLTLNAHNRINHSPVSTNSLHNQEPFILLQQSVQRLHSALQNELSYNYNILQELHNQTQTTQRNQKINKPTLIQLQHPSRTT